MKFFFTCFSMWLIAYVACAVNSMEQKFLCPICGTHWEQRVETSGQSRGLRLDLRQLGDVVDPPTLPQCPKCRFPLFSERLIEQANDPAKEKAFKRLRTFVLGPDFQMLAAKNPSYFALALVQAVIGDERHPTPHRYMALSYLRASWQVEDREAACRRYLEKAREHYVSALDGMEADDRRRSDLALLCGEVERRLGKWDEAESRFRELESSGFLNGTPQSVIPAIQLKLIARRDSAPHTLDDAEIVVTRPLPPSALRLEDPGQVSVASRRVEMPVPMNAEPPPNAVALGMPIAPLPSPEPSLRLDSIPDAGLVLASPPPDAAGPPPGAPIPPPALLAKKPMIAAKPVSPPQASDMELPAVFFEVPEPSLKLPAAPSEKPERGLLSGEPPKTAGDLLAAAPVPAVKRKSAHGKKANDILKPALPKKDAENPLPPIQMGPREASLKLNPAGNGETSDVPNPAPLTKPPEETPPAASPVPPVPPLKIDRVPTESPAADLKGTPAPTPDPPPVPRVLHLAPVKEPSNFSDNPD